MMGRQLGLAMAWTAWLSASEAAVPQAVPSQAAEALGNQAAQTDTSLRQWCAQVQQEFKALRWPTPKCDPKDFKIEGTSVQGRPLVVREFGNFEDPTSSGNVTLIFSMVHSDEITPLYLGWKVMEWLEANMVHYPKMRVIVAPVVNPDGLFNKPRTRVNAKGVDVNRNFPTQDWDDKALSSWKKSFRSSPRRFPGWKPDSEPETVFQRRLIDLYRPQKVLSFHAPLNLMDYDGPNTLALDKFSSDYVNECLKLRSRVKAKSTGFFPGSLGNYAGQERGIPTFTLELPSANPNRGEKYWRIFKSGISTLIQHEVPPLEATKPSG